MRKDFWTMSFHADDWFPWKPQPPFKLLIWLQKKTKHWTSSNTFYRFNLEEHGKRSNDRCCIYWPKQSLWHSWSCPHNRQSFDIILPACVLQSLAGPLLFLLAFNDIGGVLKHSKIVLYADGTVIYTTAKSQQEIEINLTEDFAEWPTGKKKTTL